MTISLLLGRSPNRHSPSIRAAVVLAASAMMLGCAGDTITTAAPIAAPVFTRVVILTDFGRSSMGVGDTLGVQVLAVDQYGVSMIADTMYQTASNSRIASIVYTPGSKWDYGDSEVIVALYPGEFVLTATATVHGVSHSSTKSIEVEANHQVF